MKLYKLKKWKSAPVFNVFRMFSVILKVLLGIFIKSCLTIKKTIVQKLLSFQVLQTHQNNVVPIQIKHNEASTFPSEADHTVFQFQPLVSWPRLPNISSGSTAAAVINCVPKGFVLLAGKIDEHILFFGLTRLIKLFFCVRLRVLFFLKKKKHKAVGGFDNKI